MVSSSLGVPQRFIPPRFQKRGVDLRNLHCFHREKSPVKDLIPKKLALTNAHLLVNKTFILNEFIMTNEMDFKLETWLKLGDSSLSELLPEGYVCINLPVGLWGRTNSYIQKSLSMSVTLG